MRYSLKKLSNIPALIVMVILMLYFMTLPLDTMMDILNTSDLKSFLFFYVLMVASFAIGIIVQVAIHEAGHMVMGLMTGYRFISYRVLNTMIIRDDEGRMKIRKLSLPGTAGQCLMAPPDYSDRFPFFLYNAGGVLFNLIASLLTVALMPVISIRFIKGVLAGFALSGFMMVCENGIPYRNPLTPNDGMNILEMILNPESRRIFWLQMKTNELIKQGMRIGEMPEEMFEGSDEVLNSGGLGASLLVFRENRLMDRHNYEQANQLIEEWMKNGYPVAGVHRCLMLLDKATIDCLGKRYADIDDKQLLKFIKTGRTIPTVIRTEYAIALYKKDKERAQALLKEMESLRNVYPFPNDLNGDLEIMKTLTEKLP
nr:hypothetical protein [Erysipelotrichaceae bacterium]